MKYLDALFVALYQRRPNMLSIVFIVSALLLLNELTLAILLHRVYAYPKALFQYFFELLPFTNALFLAFRYRRGARSYYLHDANAPSISGWHIVGYITLTVVLFCVAGRL
ncbi:hypothetical protein [Hymenobacter rigui]|uniref:Uncharacterized protein n=1 Tax=Hymenobacter rigui TaxID=334424 RepID=A0A3R9MQU4_9BACT|nr:hypothetical protein [Hymenobacter rigui]RSK51404.1 hypothetical protein EI291_03600 [Hymenobacter rigui]